MKSRVLAFELIGCFVILLFAGIEIGFAQVSPSPEMLKQMLEDLQEGGMTAEEAQEEVQKRGMTIEQVRERAKKLDIEVPERGTIIKSQS